MRFLLNRNDKSEKKHFPAAINARKIKTSVSSNFDTKNACLKRYNSLFPKPISLIIELETNYFLAKLFIYYFE